MWWLAAGCGGYERLGGFYERLTGGIERLGGWIERLTGGIERLGGWLERLEGIIELAGVGWLIGAGGRGPRGL